MKPLKILCLAILLPWIQAPLQAQTKVSNKFPKITISDFNPISPAIDSSSAAVILADVGSSEFEGNNNGDLTLVFHTHERILIKNRSAFDEATVKVSLYTGDATFEERLDEFEATTYNLENGKIVETPLPKSAIFKEKYNRYYSNLKFTLPNIREGCIIDYKYSVKSPSRKNNIRGWNFQGQYPRLWSEYKVTIPPIYNYAIREQGYLHFAVDTSGTVFKSYSIIDPGDATNSAETISLTGNAKWAIWAMKDVPAFKRENYLASSRNFISAVKFQLHSIHYSDTHVVQVMKDWNTTAEDLLKDEDFGLCLSEGNGWLESDVARLTGAGSNMEKAKRIYAFVRDNFTCIDDDNRELSEPLKKTFQGKKGNVTDINMLLAAMLIKAGYEAIPVMLSTKSNGRATETGALLNEYNYTVIRTRVDEKYYLLDASVSRLGFGQLPADCYNSTGRLVHIPPFLIKMSADSLSEDKSSSLFVVNDDKEGVVGTYSSRLGTYESLDLRNQIAKTKKEEFIKQAVKGYSSELEITNYELDSLLALDEPVMVKHDLKIKFEDEIVYFNPIISGAWKKNPFVSATRSYPVEMPYKINETYVLNMEIPKGYKVDELPKSIRVKLNETEGLFEYLILSSGGTIQFRCRLVLEKATFSPQDYQTLRDFFTQVVKKEAEQIVFKKL